MADILGIKSKSQEKDEKIGGNIIQLEGIAEDLADGTKSFSQLPKDLADDLSYMFLESQGNMAKEMKNVLDPKDYQKALNAIIRGRVEQKNTSKNIEEYKRSHPTRMFGEQIQDATISPIGNFKPKANMILTKQGQTLLTDPKDTIVAAKPPAFNRSGNQQKETIEIVTSNVYMDGEKVGEMLVKLARKSMATGN